MYFSISTKIPSKEMEVPFMEYDWNKQNIILHEPG